MFIVVSALFCLQMTYVTDFSCTSYLLPGFPSLMSSRSQPSCLYSTVLDNVASFRRNLNEIFLLVFHWKGMFSFMRQNKIFTHFPSQEEKFCYFDIGFLFSTTKYQYTLRNQKKLRAVCTGTGFLQFSRVLGECGAV